MRLLYLYMITPLLFSGMVKAQTIGFPAQKLVKQGSLRLDISVNEHENEVYQILSDFGDRKPIPFGEDKTVNLSGVDNERIYNFGVTFGSLTRYYQCYVPSAFPANASVFNCFERPFFRYPSSTNDLLLQLDQLVSAVVNDSLAIPRVNYIISFSLYDDGPGKCIAIYGKYSTAGVLGELNTMLKRLIQDEFAGNPVLKKLLSEMVDSPLVVNPSHHYPSLSPTAFTKVAENKNLVIYLIRESNSVTLYIKPK